MIVEKLVRLFWIIILIVSAGYIGYRIGKRKK